MKKRKPIKKPRRPTATPKQTGGGGFVFEDKVAAYFAIHQLSTQPPFDYRHGSIVEIDFQTHPDGWIFDDLLLTMKASAQQFRIAVSVKSDRQITTAGVTQKLNRQLWTEYLNENALVFNKASDFLCLATAPLGVRVAKDISELVAQASNSTSDKLALRTKLLSAAKQRIISSLKCPSDLAAKHKVRTSDVYTLLSRFTFLEFDFEMQNSTHERRLRQLCKHQLQTPSTTNVTNLYNRLAGLRSVLAPVAGKLTYKTLVDALRHDFPLKGITDHNADWLKLTELTNSNLAIIKSELGGALTLDRSDELNSLRAAIEKSDLVGVHGRSGFGKTVLMKVTAIESLAKGQKLIWLDGNSLENKRLASLPLQHSMKELMENIQDKKAILILDGIERYKNEHFAFACQLIKSTHFNGSPWRVIFTCQSEDLDTSMTRLRQNNIDIGEIWMYEMSELSEQNLDSVVDTFPELLELSVQEGFSGIFKNLKYLDLLAYHAAEIKRIKSGRMVNEIDVIEWIWAREVSSLPNGTQCSSFLQLMADHQAQNYSIGVSVSVFNIGELAPVDVLKSGKLIVEHGEKLFFQHDMFGDWARFKLILGQITNARAYLLSKEILSPLWMRAIRLYGVFLIEGDSEGSGWKRAIDTFEKTDPKAKIIQDILLESIVFSSNPESSLKKTWSKLISDNGTLLSQLLALFLNKGTVPNPGVVSWAKLQPQFTTTIASTFDRLPIYHYWPALIKFLFEKQHEIPTSCRIRVSEIAGIWLRRTPVDTPAREYAAQLAFLNANWVFNEKMSGTFIMNEVCQPIFRAMIAGINEFPEVIKDLLFKIVRRREFRSVIEKQQIRSLLAEMKIQEGPLPNGPLERIDDSFLELCVNDGEALHPLIRFAPVEAIEIILALFIHPPTERFDYQEYRYDYDMTDPYRWTPPFYTRGPFMYFLRINPASGITLVIKLVDFATTGQLARASKPQSDELNLELIVEGNPKKFRGGQVVFGWCSDAGSPSHVVSSALMALEFFFYESVEQGLDIEPWIRQILRESDSIAFLGTLLSIGKFKPPLFLSSLKPLLHPLEIYRWDFYTRASTFVEMIGHRGEATEALAEAWNSYPHRRVSFTELAPRLSFEYQELQDEFITITDKWIAHKQKLKVKTYEPYFENLICLLRHENLKVKETEHGKHYIYEEPEDLIEEFSGIRAELEAGSELQLYSYHCRNALKNKVPYDADKIKVVWDKIQEFSKVQDEMLYDYINPRAHAIFGGIALLIAHRQVWIDKHPEYLPWILDYTEQMVTNWNPTRESFMVGMIDFHWEEFCVEILAVLWTQNHSDKKIRKILALFSNKAGQVTINSLMTKIGSSLTWYDKDFVQLQNFMIERAIRDVHSKSLEAEKNSVSRFVKSTFPETLYDWTEFLKSTGKNNEDINDDFLGNIFSGLPTDTDRLDASGYEYVSIFWNRAIEHIIQKLILVDFESDRFLQSFDSWVLKRLCLFIPEVKSSDKPERYWKKMFIAGELMEKHLIKFMTHYYGFNLARKEKFSAFFDEWTKMLEVAWKLKGWHISKAAMAKEIWLSLYGLNAEQMNYWKEQHQDFIGKAHLHFVKWLDKVWPDQEVINRLLIVLITKSWAPFISQGLMYTQKYIQHHYELQKTKPRDGFVLVPFKYNESLASTLSFIWENRHEALISDAACFQNYKYLVTHLVSIQNAVGQELKDKMVS